MMRRHTILGVVVVLVVSLLVVPAVAFAAPKIGTGGWYWPTTSESFRGMSGYWASRGRTTRHLAQDIRASRGAAVFAVTDGTVLESKNVRGYGPGGSSGGAVVIQHRDARGQKFTALYGHLKGLRYKKGQRVKAGAVIGYINGTRPAHLHFGIRTGWALPSDRNPFRGHTYTLKNRYGFVDPVAYLRTHEPTTTVIPPTAVTPVEPVVTTTPPPAPESTPSVPSMPPVAG